MSACPLCRRCPDRLGARRRTRPPAADGLDRDGHLDPIITRVTFETATNCGL